MTSAAAPATCGAAAELPRKPEVLQPLNAPKICEDTLSGPTRSGFRAPLMVGPRELYGASAPVCQQTAPTVTTEGEVPGSTMLPSGTSYSSCDVVMKRSKRGVPVPWFLRIARKRSWSVGLV